MKFYKFRFHNNKRATAGLVLSYDEMTAARDLTGLSRLFPIYEATIMKVYQVSPLFDSREEAMAHTLEPELPDNLPELS